MFISWCHSHSLNEKMNEKLKTIWKEISIRNLFKSNADYFSTEKKNKRNMESTAEISEDYSKYDAEEQVFVFRLWYLKMKLKIKY